MRLILIFALITACHDRRESTPRDATPIDAAEDAGADDAGESDAGEGDAGAIDERIVQTTAGPVRGVDEGDLLVFRGIPYAAPPIGDRRWREPAAPEPWTEVRDAAAFGAACVQPEVVAGGQTQIVGSEDCLTLNVWTPSTTASEPLPVMVWIHGGYFVIGSSGLSFDGVDLYDGAHLADSGPAVVVTMNYRIGVFGYLAHPGLSAETAYGGSGNYATMDQIRALEWVRDNIRSFGGDPDRVMIFGQSSGGSSVATLLASSRAAGLFSRAVLMSSGGYANPLATAETQGESIAAAAGCSDAACLRGRTAESLALAVANGGFTFAPTIDGGFLSETFASAFRAGRAASVPTIVMTSANEFSTLIANFFPTPITTPQGYEDTLVAIYGQAFADQLLAVYPLSSYGDDPMAALTAILSDATYTCPAREMARGLSTHQPVYRSIYTHVFHRGALVPFGAGHGFDLFMIFQNFTTALGFDLDAQELQLADQMTHHFTEFAKSGAPSEAIWTQYDAAADGYLSLDLPLTAETGFRTTECDFWEPYVSF